MEHPIINESLVQSVEGIEGDKRSRERRSHLRQRERPHRHARSWRVLKCATGNFPGDPFTRD
jgi:hypothetical protein